MTSRSSLGAFRSIAIGLGVLSVVALVSAPPVSAHWSKKTDGNDSPSRLDIRSTIVVHKWRSVAYNIRTYNRWKPSSLGSDSYFVVQIDKNNDTRYERCAFIYYRSRLRGTLTNCHGVSLGSLRVAKISRTAARIAIPKKQVGLVYWWAISSVWRGPAPCGGGCVDNSPNRFPDVMHDLKRPFAGVMNRSEALRVWGGSTTLAFEFPFRVADADSGIASWTVQRRSLSGTRWRNVDSGTGGGNILAHLVATAGTHSRYRVVARDEQGNRGISPSRIVLAPLDDDGLDPSLFRGVTRTVTHVNAFGGSYRRLGIGDSFRWRLEAFDLCIFELVGPGGGTWVVDVEIRGSRVARLRAANFPDRQRQTLFTLRSCADPSTIRFRVASGSGFGVDAVLPAHG
jgi:hypothetical protein